MRIKGIRIHAAGGYLRPCSEARMILTGFPSPSRWPYFRAYGGRSGRCTPDQLRRVSSRLVIGRQEPFFCGPEIMEARVMALERISLFPRP